ncbi:MAG TPA: hypothetical protein VLB09_07600, partial [Nitrospiria bacterium]|nr:hypothetical protein [Nitrospiria bacterium]
MKTGDTGQTYSKKVLEFLKEKHWFSLVFLVFLSAAAYLQTTGYGFAWDDHRLVKGGISTTEDLGDWLEFTGQIFQRWSQMTFRPVPMVLFSLDYLFWGNS